MTTGNPERDALLARAIRETIAVGEPPMQIGFVSDKLPHDFDLSDEELKDALREMKLLGEESLRDVWPPETVSMPVEAAPEPTDEATITREQAWVLVENANQRLGNARLAVRRAQAVLGDKKGNLATAITAWQQGIDPLTPEQRRQREVRNYLASEQERKQKLKDAGLRGPRMRTDKFPAQDPASGRMGHKGSHRGAFPGSFQHRNTNAPGMLHGAMVKKV